MERNVSMKTILKWPGGKEHELKNIQENMPPFSGRYIEPFVGGGAVFFSIDGHRAFINDKSSDLMNFYACVGRRDDNFVKSIHQECDEFTRISAFVDGNASDVLALYASKISIDNFLSAHDALYAHVDEAYRDIFIAELKRNLASKIQRAARIEARKGALSDSDRLDNMEAALKSAYYMCMRQRFNHGENLSDGARAAVFFFVREYCYSSMFRYNSQGEFNVPYGGISYNRKDFRRKIDYALSDDVHEKLSSATLSCLDFEDFMDGLNLTRDDFVFLDPPYDSDFSTYAMNAFGKAEQERLASCLKRTRAKFMLVIKNTQFIHDLYAKEKRFNIIDSFKKTYRVSFMNRNERRTRHLIITNY